MLPALVVQQPGLGVITADNMNTKVDSGGALLANLQNFVGIPGSTVYMVGYTVAGDGGQGMWTWNAGLTSGDNTTSILPNGSVQGGWARLGLDTLTQAAYVPPTAYVPADVSGAGLVLSSTFGEYWQVGNTVFVAFSVTYPSTANTNGGILSLPVQVPNKFYAACSALCRISGTTPSWVTNFVAVPSAFEGGFLNAATQANITNAQLSGATVSCLSIYPLA